MNICFISDNNYVTYISTLIVSILKNSSEKDYLYFHLIEVDIEEENKNKLLMLKEIKDFEIKFYKPNYDNIEKYKKWNKIFKENGYSWHYSIFIKLDISFILKDLESVLYIDADTIVLDSLGYIFNMDISNYPFVSQQVCFNHIKSMEPKLYKYMLDIGYKNPEFSYVGGSLLLFNIKKIKEIFTKESYENKIDECVDKYINSIFTEEHVFSYIFKDNISFLDFKADYGDNTEKLIISGYFADSGKPLKYSFNMSVNEYYYKFWEYFYLTPFFNENYFKYMDIFYTNKIKNALYKIVDKMVWIIPLKKIRDKIRKNIIKDIDNVMNTLN